MFIIGWSRWCSSSSSTTVHRPTVSKKNCSQGMFQFAGAIERGTRCMSIVNCIATTFTRPDAAVINCHGTHSLKCLRNSCSCLSRRDHHHHPLSWFTRQLNNKAFINRDRDRSTSLHWMSSNCSLLFFDSSSFLLLFLIIFFTVPRSCSVLVISSSLNARKSIRFPEKRNYPFECFFYCDI